MIHEFEFQECDSGALLDIYPMDENPKLIVIDIENRTTGEDATMLLGLQAVKELMGELTKWVESVEQTEACGTGQSA